MLIRPDLQVFETLPVPLAVLRGDVVVYANRALAALLGLQTAALVGASSEALLARFVTHGDAGWLREVNRARVQGAVPSPSLWARIRAADGEEREVCMRQSEMPGRDGESLVLVLDADAEALSRRLSRALAGAADSFVRCRDEANVLDKAMAVLAGQGLRAAILLLQGEELRFGPGLLPEGAREQIERLAGLPITAVRLPLTSCPAAERLFAGGEPVYFQDARVSARGLGVGAELAEALLESHRLFAAPIRLEEGPFGLLVVEGESLTPAAAATLALFTRHLGAALENARHHKRAAQRLKEIAQVQDALVAQERAAAVGDAAAVLAHEVRNPLGAILNAVALLKRNAGKLPTEDLLEMIEEEAERIDGLVTDLLDLARPLEPRVRPIDLEPLVRRAIELAAAIDNRAVVELIAASPAVQVNADPHLVQVAVENLVRNAVQSSPPGGRVAVRIGGDEILGSVVVEDQGPGIAPPDASRIFEPFFTTRQTGKGLGLAVVKRVAEVHGGSVEVRAAEGGGATFELRLPRD
ncbi:sensor histidine kinase [Vulgatibacter sp.]|uniref:sensor histidine kinase n=1 Tax=Vulgatibacter sp. TaxID=1971226 RepID=UPI00356AEB4C